MVKALRFLLNKEFFNWSHTENSWPWQQHLISSMAVWGFVGITSAVWAKYLNHSCIHYLLKEEYFQNSSTLPSVGDNWHQWCQMILKFWRASKSGVSKLEFVPYQELQEVLARIISIIAYFNSVMIVDAAEHKLAKWLMVNLRNHVFWVKKEEYETSWTNVVFLCCGNKINDNDASEDKFNKSKYKSFI